MARTILVAGTASHVGKSTVAAGLCRALADRGVDVAPFKGQNMSNNARVAPTAPGSDADGPWGEIGVSQHAQARAARVPASTDVNPVLLKPRGDGESQLVIDGEAVTHCDTATYYGEHWHRARDAAAAAHERLAARHDVVVAEGAGSLGEPNLRDRDIANVETARFADADVVLVADVERGGAFAAVVGTLALAPDDVADRVVGVVLNRFRGDPALLDDAVDELERRTGVSVLGVLPHDDPGLPAEDSLSLPGDDTAPVIDGEGDDVSDERAVTVAVPRLPRLSNATDLAPLARTPGVRVAYRPLDAGLGDTDAVVLPGTKNTVDDLLALRRSGLHEALRGFDGPIVGICGGYQMLGERLVGADREGTGDAETVEGVGLLPVETRFRREKTVERVRRSPGDAWPFGEPPDAVEGYEIHAGETRHLDDVASPLGPASAVRDDVLGTYLHGLFEEPAVREGFVDHLTERRGVELSQGRRDDGDPFDRAGTLVENDLAVDRLVEGRRVAER